MVSARHGMAAYLKNACSGRRTPDFLKAPDPGRIFHEHEPTLTETQWFQCSNAALCVVSVLHGGVLRGLRARQALGCAPAAISAPRCQFRSARARNSILLLRMYTLKSEGTPLRQQHQKIALVSPRWASARAGARAFSR
ncbi:hypothetical protein CNY67_15255 [Desulfovibrio sp. G11]|nr:hypothetical protein CNY67_15255 [Desulfovibrio sp. G11]